MDGKIIQIIPAPAGLLAHFSDYEDGQDGYEQAVCLALVECDNGKDTEIRALCCGPDDDYIDFAEDSMNFKGLCFRPQKGDGKNAR